MSSIKHVILSGAKRRDSDVLRSRRISCDFLRSFDSVRLRSATSNSAQDDNLHTFKIYFLLLFILHTSYFILATGCYSFTGASIPPHIHSIGIPLVEDNSGFGQSAIRQNITDQLIQKFNNEGSLRVASVSSSDAKLEATIPASGIDDQPVSVAAGNIVTTKQISLKVHAIYTDQKKQKVFWERDFSETAQYAISGGLPAQQTALSQAEDKVTSDILIAVISNW